MARYDVYRFNNKRVSYVLDVQTNILEHLNTVVVIPFMGMQDAHSEVIDRLKPIIKIHEVDYVLITTDISVLPRNELRDYVCNIEEDYSLKIIEALDFLFQGF